MAEVTAPPSPPTRPSPRMTDERSRTEHGATPVAVVPPPRLEPTAPERAAAPGGSHASLLEQITGAIRTAAAHGDLDTARALHAALGRALGGAPPADEESGARVVPLRGRGKRGAQ
ncbi:hypothetical protein ACSRUE_01525 [Sorangium sp. KYC3313]|uniref:hypothetical protein n=1 Tax=Sorangium sp. KYC3313 TaxID=3449740 RepID=UPI003F88BE24